MRFSTVYIVPILFALLLASTSLVALVDRLSRIPTASKEYAFEEIATNLYRMSYTIKLVPRIIESELSVFLVKDKEDFILIDAGWPGKDYGQLLMPALENAMKGGTLRLIVLTHG